MQNLETFYDKILKRKKDIIFESEDDLNIHSITIDKIKEILNKNPKERNFDELIILNFYCLNKTNVFIKFSKENIDSQNCEKILALSQMTASYLKIDKINTPIYNYDDESRYLYIILKGTAKILRLEKMKKKIKGNNYFKLLINYRNKKENFICNHTILKNRDIFPVNIHDLPILEKILLKIYLTDYDIEINNDDFLEMLVKNSCLDYSFFNIESYRDKLLKKNLEVQKYNEEKIMQKNYFQIKELYKYDAIEAKKNVIENIKIINKYVEDIPLDKCKKYSFFKGVVETMINYYVFEEDKNLSEGDYFGDNHDGKFIHTAISTSDELELYLIENKFIDQYINSKLTKNIKSQINNILKNYFFNGISSYIFEKYFFHLFEVEYFKSGEKICQENQPVNYIYFIRSGQVKLISKKSIKEIYTLNNILKEKIKEKHLSINFYENLNLEDKINKLPKYDFDFSNIGYELENKKNIHIITYQKNQCIGYECLFYGVNYLYTAIADGKNVEVFKLSSKHLMEIFEYKNEKLYLDFCNKSEQNILFILNRLIQVIKIKLLLLEDKYNNKTNINKTTNLPSLVSNNTKNETFPKRNNSQINLSKVNEKNIFIKKLSLIKNQVNTSRKSEKSINKNNLSNSINSLISRKPHLKKNNKKVDEFLIKRLNKIKEKNAISNIIFKLTQTLVKNNEIKRNNSEIKLKNIINYKKLIKNKSNIEKNECHFYSVNDYFKQDISVEIEKKFANRIIRAKDKFKKNNIKNYLVLYKNIDYHNFKTENRRKLEDLN